MSPMSSARNFTIAHLLMACIFLVGITVRLLNLGGLPLSDREAEAALQALQFSNGSAAGFSGAGIWPAYMSLTGLAMYLFGDTNFIARMVPALSGALLVLVPFLFRDRLGLLPALLLGSGLALDPLLVNVSRFAAGPGMAAGLLLVTMSLRIATSGDRLNPVYSIILAALAGLALLSGPPVFFGGLTLLFTYAAQRAFGFSLLGENNGMGGEATGSDLFSWKFGGVFLLTVVLGSTGFMRTPAGIAALAGSFPAFLAGWVEPSTVPVLQVLLSLFAYEFIVLGFGFIHIVRSWRSKNPNGKFLSIWFGSALLLLLIYPGRQVADLVWVSVPLWALAASEIGRPVYWKREHVFRPMILAGVLVIFLISFWTNITSLSYVVPEDPQFTLRLLIIAGTLILGALSISLVNMGWSRDAAASGTVWGLCVILLFGMISGVWGTSHRNAVGLRELWLPLPASGEADLLEMTLQSVGGWFNGSAENLDVLYSVESPALQWSLRRYSNAQPGVPVPGNELPEVIITPGHDQEVRVASAYRGQGLIWRIYPAWNELDREAWLRWLLFKEAPATNDEIIIWLRADLFLAYNADPTADLFPLDALEEDSNESFVPLEDPVEILPGH